MRLIDADALIANKFKNDISYNAFVSLVKRQPTVTITLQSDEIERMKQILANSPTTIIPNDTTKTGR